MEDMQCCFKVMEHDEKYLILPEKSISDDKKSHKNGLILNDLFLFD